MHCSEVDLVGMGVTTSSAVRSVRKQIAILELLWGSLQWLDYIPPGVRVNEKPGEMNRCGARWKRGIGIPAYLLNFRNGMTGRNACPTCRAVRARGACFCALFPSGSRPACCLYRSPGGRESPAPLDCWHRRELRRAPRWAGQCDLQFRCTNWYCRRGFL